MHVQEHEFSNQSLSSLDLFHVAQTFEMRKKLSEKLVQQAPFSNLHMDTNNTDQHLLYDSDVCIEDEINAILTNKQRFKPRPSNIPLTNAQFYEKSCTHLLMRLKIVPFQTCLSFPPFATGIILGSLLRLLN